LRALLVTAFYDIGRGSWAHLERSNETYVAAYRGYLEQLPAPRYVLADEQLRSAVEPRADVFDAAPFSSLPAHRYLTPTRDVMQSDAFQALFPADARRAHIEQYIPEYNVLMMMKWDALERAAALSGSKYSHYVWADFGLGKRTQRKPYLPAPRGFRPIERDEIVLSASRDGALMDGDAEMLRRHVATFVEQVAGSLMIIPADKLAEFCSLARRSYERLLSMGLTTDDQLVIDMCRASRPELFHLSYAPRGLTKFNHIHNILNGLDAAQPRSYEIPIWDAATRKITRSFARRRLGL
jgi:hypothetical protein